MKIYQVDAFASKLFKGNPAAVMILEQWLPEETMQNIAMENNLAETAYVVKQNDSYHIRWFTPEIEVDLCGHATLASAHVLFEHLNIAADSIHFFSPRSGDLFVKKTHDGIQLNFPTDAISEIDFLEGLEEALGAKPVQLFKGKTDYMAIFDSEEEVASLNVNFLLLNQIDTRGIITTAPGHKHDFISRFFCPNCGVPEDPVTGSAHTTLIPYWTKRLDKTKLFAKQISSRGGELACEYLGDRVVISGSAVTYLQGEVAIPT